MIELGGNWGAGEVVGKKDESTFAPEAIVSIQLQRASAVTAKHHFSYSCEMMDGLNPFPDEDFIRKTATAISFFFRAALKDPPKKEEKNPPHLPMDGCGGNFVRLEFKTGGRGEYEVLHHKLYLFCGESTDIAVGASSHHHHGRTNPGPQKLTPSSYTSEK